MPHECIGKARRLSPTDRTTQHKVLLGAVLNHTPEVTSCCLVLPNFVCNPTVHCANLSLKYTWYNLHMSQPCWQIDTGAYHELQQRHLQ